MEQIRSYSEKRRNAMCGPRGANNRIKEVGAPVFERAYKAPSLGAWPRHTDFKSDNLDVRD